MNAKHSAILLSGLLVLMIGIAWAQGSNISSPTCPAVPDEMLQSMLIPTAWVRADWNANTARWEIDCSQIDAIANMALPANAYNAVGNAAFNATNSVTPRRRSRGNGNYVNSSPYRSPYSNAGDAANATAANANSWANVAVNAMNATPPRRPATRRRPSD